MNRAERRERNERSKKAAARKLARHNATPTPAQVGRAAAMHNTCPCWMCTGKEQEHKRRVLADAARFYELGQG